MPHTQTHTFATIAVSPSCFREIKTRLERADYGHCLLNEGATLDMTGIGLEANAPAPEPTAEIPRISNLLEMLTKRARAFRADRGHFTRNSHMHDLKEAPPQDVVDAILTGFLNDVGIGQGVDYAIYASDIARETSRP